MSELCHVPTFMDGNIREREDEMTGLGKVSLPSDTSHLRASYDQHAVHETLKNSGLPSHPRA